MPNFPVWGQISYTFVPMILSEKIGSRYPICSHTWLSVLTLLGRAVLQSSLDFHTSSLKGYHAIELVAVRHMAKKIPHLRSGIGRGALETWKKVGWSHRVAWNLHREMSFVVKWNLVLINAFAIYRNWTPSNGWSIYHLTISLEKSCYLSYPFIWLYAKIMKA